MGAKKLEVVNPDHLPEDVRKALETAKSRCGDDRVFLLESEESGIQVVCRAPDRPTYRKFRTERNDPARKAGAFETLFLSCLQYPTPKDFEATLDRLPALADSFGMALWAEVLGAEDATIKKA